MIGCISKNKAKSKHNVIKFWIIIYIETKITISERNINKQLYLYSKIKIRGKQNQVSNLLMRTEDT